MTPSMFDEHTCFAIHAYLDGELDPANAISVERRIASDPELASACGRIEALQGLIREHPRADAWPRGLRTRVEAAVGIENPRLPLPRAQLSWCVLAYVGCSCGDVCVNESDHRMAALKAAIAKDLV